MTYYTYPHMQYEIEMKARDAGVLDGPPGTGALPITMGGPSGGGEGTGEAMGPGFETQIFDRSSILLLC